MLIRHSFLYLSGRIVPALASLATLFLYTRILGVEQYGNYALVVAASGVANAICFQWINLSLGRFFSLTSDNRALLSSVLAGFFIMMAVTGVVSGIVMCLTGSTFHKFLIAVTTIICWAQAWFELNTKILNARLQASRYSYLTSLKAILVFGGSVLFFYYGLGFYGIFAGLVIGLLVPTALARMLWKGVSLSHLNRTTFTAILRYGAPLTLSFGSAVILSVSDRFFLKKFLGTESVGLYAAAFDLTQQSLGMLMSVINLAAFPLVLQALNTHGATVAQSKLRESGEILLAAAIPAAVGLSILSENIGSVLLGHEFQSGADKVISIVALSALASGIRSYYFDYSFHLSKNVRGQVIAIISAAVLNIFVNIILIPLLGTLGAAIASLASACFGIVMSWILGRAEFPVPKLTDVFYKVSAAAFGMALVLWPIRESHGLLSLVGQILTGLAVYLLIAYALDIVNLRGRVKQYINKFSAT